MTPVPLVMVLTLFFIQSVKKLAMSFFGTGRMTFLPLMSAAVLTFFADIMA